jgi:hypothetical protein
VSHSVHSPSESFTSLGFYVIHSLPTKVKAAVEEEKEIKQEREVKGRRKIKEQREAKGQ